MISLSIFPPFRRWPGAADRELQRKRSFEELKEEVRLMLREKRS